MALISRTALHGWKMHKKENISWLKDDYLIKKSQWGEGVCFEKLTLLRLQG